MFPTLAGLPEERMRHHPELIHAVVHSLNEWMLETWGQDGSFVHSNQLFNAPVVSLPIVEKAIEAELGLEYSTVTGTFSSEKPESAAPGTDSMTASPAPDTSQHTSIAGWLENCRQRPLVYRAVVVAPDSLSVLRNLGGWIFDTTTAGWQVAVAVPDHDHHQSFDILGAHLLDLDQALAAGIDNLQAHILAMATEPGQAPLETRDTVATDAELPGFTLWGSQLPSTLDGPLATRVYRLSAAARAFKTVAINTAGFLDETATLTEAMRLPERGAESPGVRSTLSPAPGRSLRTAGRARVADSAVR